MKAPGRWAAADRKTGGVNLSARRSAEQWGGHSLTRAFGTIRVDGAERDNGTVLGSVFLPGEFHLVQCECDMNEKNYKHKTMDESSQLNICIELYTYF